jgi:hypothetical protein
MPKRARSISRMARAIPLAVMLTFGAGGAASAVEDCLASPNRQADPGTRWTQRFDRVNNRQCWYLKKDAAAAPPPSAASVDPAASPNADDQSNIMSWLSSKFGAMTRSGSAATEPSATQAAPEAQPKRRPRVAKRSDAGNAPPRQPSSTASGQPPAAAPFDAETREALFKEYLEWKKQQPSPK